MLDLEQRFGTDFVDSPLALDTGSHQTHVAQSTQVFGGCRLTEPQVLDQLPDGARALEQ